MAGLHLATLWVCSEPEDPGQKIRALAPRCKGVDVWLGEKEMRSKEVRYMHISVTHHCALWNTCPLRTCFSILKLFSQCSCGCLVLRGQSALQSSLGMPAVHSGGLSSPLKKPQLRWNLGLPLLLFRGSTITILFLISLRTLALSSLSSSPTPCMPLLHPRPHSTAWSVCVQASLSPSFSSVCLSYLFFLFPDPVSPSSDFSPLYTAAVIHHY